MRRYTKHLQTILQTQNIAKHKNKSTHTPQTWSMERRKMLASTIQFSHNTPTPQQPHTHTAHDHSRAGQQDNHNHTTKAWLLCAAPDTQQHANTLNNIVCRIWLPPRFATQALHVLRVCIHPEFQTKTVAVTHSATQPPHTHNRGHYTK